MTASARLHKFSLVRRCLASPYVAGEEMGGLAMRFVVLVPVVLVVLIGGLSRSHGQELRLFTVGSGSIGGGYYAAARAICDAFNRSEGPRLRCSPEPTAGSLYNLAMLRQGQLDFAFIQSDWQSAALEGTGPFASDGPMTDLRSVMALYPEMITVVARRDGGIETVSDLIGKRLDIGQPGSGRNASLSHLLAMLDLGRADFSALSELPAESAMVELCAGRIDAAVLIVGHPNSTVGRTLRNCDVTLVPFEGPKIDDALEATPEIRRAVIRAGTYPQSPSDVPTYAVVATVVTRADVDEALVEHLVASTLTNLPEIAVRAPVLRDVVPATMRTDGLTAPLQQGAEAGFAAGGAAPQRRGGSHRGG